MADYFVGDAMSQRIADASAEIARLLYPLPLRTGNVPFASLDGRPDFLLSNANGVTRKKLTAFAQFRIVPLLQKRLGAFQILGETQPRLGQTLIPYLGDE